MKEAGSSGPLSRQQKKFLALALRVASSSENIQRHGAVVVKGGRVLSLAPNIWKNNAFIFEAETSSREEVTSLIREHCSVHAEARALKQLSPEAARGSTVYVARVSPGGWPLLSRPCEGCWKTLEEAGVKSVVYTEAAKDSPRSKHSWGSKVAPRTLRAAA